MQLVLIIQKFPNLFHEQTKTCMFYDYRFTFKLAEFYNCMVKLFGKDGIFEVLHRTSEK